MKTHLSFLSQSNFRASVHFDDGLFAGSHVSGKRSRDNSLSFARAWRTFPPWFAFFRSTSTPQCRKCRLGLEARFPVCSNCPHLPESPNLWYLPPKLSQSQSRIFRDNWFQFLHNCKWGPIKSFYVFYWQGRHQLTDILKFTQLNFLQTRRLQWAFLLQHRIFCIFKVKERDLWCHQL